MKEKPYKSYISIIGTIVFFILFLLLVSYSGTTQREFCKTKGYNGLGEQATFLTPVFGTYYCRNTTIINESTIFVEKSFRRE